jgi:hypothetical protein
MKSSLNTGAQFEKINRVWALEVMSIYRARRLRHLLDFSCQMAIVLSPEVG